MENIIHYQYSRQDFIDDMARSCQINLSTVSCINPDYVIKTLQRSYQCNEFDAKEAFQLYLNRERHASTQINTTDF